MWPSGAHDYKILFPTDVDGEADSPLTKDSPAAGLLPPEVREALLRPTLSEWDRQPHITVREVALAALSALFLSLTWEGQVVDHDPNPWGGGRQARDKFAKLG